MKKYILILTIAALAGQCRQKPAWEHGGTLYTGKPHAPVDLSWSAQKNIAPGQPLIVRYTAKALVDVSALRAEVTLPAELRRVSGETAVNSTGAMTPGQSISGEITVTGSAEGLFYLGLHGTMTTSAGKSTNTIAIPVGLGSNPEPMLKKPGSVSGSGDSVIIEIPSGH